MSLLFFCAGAWGAVGVEIKVSKIHGFYRFLEAIEGKPHSSELILKAYTESKYRTPENDALIANLNQATVSSSGFDFKGFPDSRRAGVDFGNLMMTQSTLSASLDDFAGRTLGLMPLPDHSQFFKAAKRLMPVYEKLIWDSSLESLKRYQSELKKISARARLNDLFDRAIRFYGAEWPADQPFVISLYPIPGAKGATLSTSMDTVESVGVLNQSKDNIGAFGVIFHEMSHSIFAAQPIAFQFEIEKIFYSHSSPYAIRAYELLNEALATALGNGIAEKAVTRKLYAGSWYNNVYIDSFAKAIYPKVEEYFMRRQTMDLAFANSIVTTLEAKLASAIYDYDNLFQWTTVVHDGFELSSREIQKAVRSLFRVNTWNSHDPMDGKDALDEAQKSRHLLLVIYTRGAEGSKQQLKTLAERIPLIKNHLDEMLKRDREFIFAGLDATGRPIVVLQLMKPTDLVSALTKLKSHVRMDPSMKFVE